MHFNKNAIHTQTLQFSHEQVNRQSTELIHKLQFESILLQPGAKLVSIPSSCCSGVGGSSYKSSRSDDLDAAALDELITPLLNEPRSNAAVRTRSMRAVTVNVTYRNKALY